MHEIQSQILKQLTLSEKARYSAIKPPKVEGNQFAYHLKKVIDDGYVKKEGLFYSLTEKGERFADTISMKTFTRRAQPKIVTMTVIKNNKGELLFGKRDKQPFIGKLFLPYGKTHLGERVEEAAKREVREKTGLETEKITRRGDIYLIIYKGDELISHMLCHLFEIKLSGSEKTVAQHGTWLEPKKIDFGKCIPGTKNILELIAKEKDGFFREIFVEV